MWRLALIVLATAAVVAFTLVNVHHVEMGLVFGQPVRIRLVFLLLIAFSAGSICTLITQQVLEIRHKARVRQVAEETKRDLLDV